jgi:hypothetical protein
VVQAVADVQAQCRRPNRRWQRRWRAPDVRSPSPAERHQAVTIAR